MCYIVLKTYLFIKNILGGGRRGYGMGVSYISLWDITSELGLVMLWDRFYLLFYLAFLMSYVHVSLSWCIFEEISFV